MSDAAAARNFEELATSDHLEQLGSAGTKYPTRPEDAKLEAIPWRGGPTVCEWDCPEFTSVCPKTGQPDFARIRFRLVPDELLPESKAVKLYLFSFRSSGMFHEAVVAKIADDLAELLKPKTLLVRGEFTPRGGISIWPLAARTTVGGVVKRVDPTLVAAWDRWSA